MKKIFFLLFIPFVMAFDYKPILENWVLSSQEVSAVKISMYKSLGSLSQACKKEKRDFLFPTNCLYLIMEIKKIDSNVDLKLIQQRFTKMCVERSKLLVSMNQIEKAESALSELIACKKKLQQRKEIILYQQAR